MSRMIDLDDPRVVHLLCNLEPRWKPMDEVNGEDFKELNSIIGEFERFSVDAAPVVHGKWFDGECDDGGELWYCSRCNYPVKTIAGRPAFDYCPHCGAKMDEVSE